MIMKLKVKCKNCKSIIKFSSNSKDRNELALYKADVFQIVCPKCKEKCNIHVNSVIATRDSTFESVLFIVLYGGTAVIGYFIWKTLLNQSDFYIFSSVFGLIALPTTVFIIFSRSQLKKIKTFNKSKYKGVKKR